jgi:hypothetical protein
MLQLGKIPNETSQTNPMLMQSTDSVTVWAESGRKSTTEEAYLKDSSYGSQSQK